jgi:hypothetical protein
MIIDSQFDVQTDAETGLAVIVQTGRCTGEEWAAVEADCTRRYEMVILPHASGAILKSLDGTVPALVEVRPPTLTNKAFLCVKTDGRCRPFAPAQVGGPYNGQTILRYQIRYQEVGAVA